MIYLFITYSENSKQVHVYEGGLFYRIYTIRQIPRSVIISTLGSFLFKYKKVFMRKTELIGIHIKQVCELFIAVPHQKETGSCAW